MKPKIRDLIFTALFAIIAIAQELSGSSSHISLVGLLYFGLRATELADIKSRISDLENK